MRRKRKFNRGRWQVERERCRIPFAAPGASSGDAARIDADVTGLMKHLGLGESLWLNALENEWVDLVGAELARHARPGKYDNGKLTVFVDSSAWFNELKRFGRNAMLDKLRKRFGAAKICAVDLQFDPD